MMVSLGKGIYVNANNVGAVEKSPNGSTVNVQGVSFASPVPPEELVELINNTLTKGREAISRGGR